MEKEELSSSTVVRRGKRKTKVTKPPEEKRTGEMADSRSDKKKDDRTGVIIIPAKGKNYADAVRCVKEKVDLQKLGVSIKHIRTKNGDILLETKAGTGEAEKLKAAIVEAEEGWAKVLSKETRRILNLVRDLEEDALAKSIVKALQRNTKAEADSIKVRSMNRGRKGTQSALVKKVTFNLC